MTGMKQAFVFGKNTATGRQLLDLVLEEPELVEVDAQADVEIVLLKQAFVGGRAVTILESEIHDGLLPVGRESESETYAILLDMIVTDHRIVAVIESAQTI